MLLSCLVLWETGMPQNYDWSALPASFSRSNSEHGLLILFLLPARIALKKPFSEIVGKNRLTLLLPYFPRKIYFIHESGSIPPLLYIRINAVPLDWITETNYYICTFLKSSPRHLPSFFLCSASHLAFVASKSPCILWTVARIWLICDVFFGFVGRGSSSSLSESEACCL